MDIKFMRKKRMMFLLLILIVNLSGCFVKPNGINVLFFDPRLKKEYCTNKETILEAAEYLLKKVFHKKNFADYHVVVGECGDTLISTYIRKESFDSIIQIDNTSPSIVDKYIQQKTDTTQKSYYFIFPNIEKCSNNTITIAIINDPYISSKGSIVFRHDNICEIIISKKECKVIDWICR
jgi:hypothetical protein